MPGLLTTESLATTEALLCVALGLVSHDAMTRSARCVPSRLLFLTNCVCAGPILGTGSGNEQVDDLQGVIEDHVVEGARRSTNTEHDEKLRLPDPADSE